MEFIEAPALTRHPRSYLGGEEYRKLQSSLARDPEKGDMIPETGGIRKMRWADRRRGRGSRGGLRVVYFHFAEEQQIWLLTLYGKNEATDLTQREKKMLKTAIEADCAAREQARRKR